MGLRNVLVRARTWVWTLLSSFALLSVPDHPANGGIAGEGDARQDDGPGSERSQSDESR
jgi:hypothetical protein